jgi:hypothetical protein
VPLALNARASRHGFVDPASRVGHEQLVHRGTRRRARRATGHRE